jgi:hypothetical protein
MPEEIDSTTGNGRLYICSVDTSTPFGALVQEYADKHYKKGFLHGICFGVIVSSVGFAIGVSIVAKRR